MGTANHSQNNTLTPVSHQLRAFIGVPIASDLAQAICHYYQETLPSDTQQILRWTKLGHFHITLKFIASLDEALVTGLVTDIRGLLATQERFNCQLKEVVWFPRLNRPRLLALLVSSSGVLPALALSINQLCQQWQIPKETKPFRPHLTLARLKKRVHPHKPLPAAFIQQFEVNEINLYQSTVSNEGSLYKILATFPLLEQ